MGSALGGLFGGGGGSSMPKAPDYTKAAEQTAASNLQAAQTAAAANRVNQYTPYGNLTYSSAGKDANGNPIWNQTLTLSDAQQQLLNANNQAALGLTGLYGNQISAAQSALANPIDPNSLPAQQINPGQTAQDAIMARLQPQFDRDQSKLQTQLANQGLQPGSAAYNNAMTLYGQQKNDAYTQAALQGINVGQQARQQALQEQETLRQDPLNTLNALRSGSQVTNPTFNSVPQQATTSGTNYLGAADAAYQAALNGYSNQTASNNALMGGLFNLGGAAIGSGALNGLGSYLGGLF